MRRLLLILICVGPLLVGCSKKPETAASASPPAAPSAQPAAEKAAPAQPRAAAERVVAADVSFAAPATWKREQPRSPMRLAQLRLPGADGKGDASMSIIAAGGNVEDNIKRWEGQFEGGAPTVTRNEFEAGGTKIVWVRMDGTFLHKARPMAPGPGEPRPGWAVLAGIVRTPKAQLFLKATGPAATVSAHADAFEAMLRSVKPVAE